MSITWEVPFLAEWTKRELTLTHLGKMENSQFFGFVCSLFNHREQNRCSSYPGAVDWKDSTRFHKVYLPEALVKTLDTVQQERENTGKHQGGLVHSRSFLICTRYFLSLYLEPSRYIRDSLAYTNRSVEQSRVHRETDTHARTTDFWPIWWRKDYFFSKWCWDHWTRTY